MKGNESRGNKSAMNIKKYNVWYWLPPIEKVNKSGD